MAVILEWRSIKMEKQTVLTGHLEDSFWWKRELFGQKRNVKQSRNVNREENLAFQNFQESHEYLLFSEKSQFLAYLIFFPGFKIQILLQNYFLSLYLSNVDQP